MRRLVLLSALLAAAALVAPSAGTAGGRPATARLAACDSDDRTATFEADMRAVPGAVRMQLRFTLQVRQADGRWRKVAVPAFETWVSALAGRARWIYEKEVERLGPGTFRMLVRFRWRGPAGDVVRSSARRTRGCTVPDDRPDLVPEDVAVGPGPAADRRQYVVTVANRGRSAAPATMVALAVDDVALPDRQVPALDPGERVQAGFVGPPCPAGGVIVVTADATGLVEEAVEAGDTLRVRCDP